MFLPNEQPLDLKSLLDALQADQHLNANDCCHVREQASRYSAHHPLETIAAAGLEDRSQPGQWLNLDTLCQWLAGKVGQPYLRIDPMQLDLAQVNGLISPAFAQRHGILIVANDANAITVASAEPCQQLWQADLARSLGKPIRRVLASPLQIRQLGQSLFRLAHSVQGAQHQQAASLGELEHLLELGKRQAEATADDAHIVHIVDWLLQYAIEQRASDIHLEPRREQGHLRYRIDGLLHRVYTFPANVMLAVVSRLKHLGRMDVAEKRRPQDGRVKSSLPGGSEVELRLSTLPTPFGEKLVLRLFDPRQLQENFDQLGLEGEQLVQWQTLLQRRQGMLLVTGPTGSGKTSTLYASLKQLATPQVNLCTIEDPIERLEPAFNQLQVQPALGLGFADGVRALLRQDPDIIMIGEIRDRETALVAVQAALTGHLVLSTLHTTDTCSAITRLLELGVADYLIRATLGGVMAQRLVRLLCDTCQGLPSSDPCQVCRGTGYRGRTGLFELLIPSESLRARISASTDLAELQRQALADGLQDLRSCGEAKAARGLTRPEEVLRVCS
ncbi:GspE/PulE family protein [Pseudomonas vlassakiae]|jgi:general secretion pathway protein E|uniref:GspE/PulE family protein n=1 Tax=Pseudomonas TaxID=286 RepID=UPI000C194DAC|nr:MULTISPECIES: GspE/PulE family protein [unclassified Pseudomonas]AXQ46331.1 type II/IV secretion system protein [Stenotrophomonas rhizophila]MBS3187985.1 type II/IV secretion system protein [Pseudomonas sp. PCH44]PIK78592.1 type II secretion system protein E [Pseudomonas sp. 382]